MKAPFNIILSEDKASGYQEDVLSPMLKEHKVLYGDAISAHTKHVTLLRKFYSGFTFYLEQINYFVKQPTVVTLRVAKPCLMFIYALEDDLNFNIPEQNKVVAKRQCFAHLIPAGDQIWRVVPGKQRFIYFVLRPAWLVKMRADYPELVETIQRLRNGNVAHKVFHPFAMTEYTASLLKRLTECRAINQFELEEGLLSTINKLVKEYHTYLIKPIKKLQKSYKQIVFEVRDQIIDEVGRGIIPNLAEISSIHGITAKALRRNCCRVFKMNPKDLVLDAQIKATDRMINDGLGVKEIAIRLGYSDASVFSRRFTKHYGYSPTTYIKNKNALSGFKY